MTRTTANALECDRCSLRAICCSLANDAWDHAPGWLSLKTGDQRRADTTTENPHDQHLCPNCRTVLKDRIERFWKKPGT